MARRIRRTNRKNSKRLNSKRLNSKRLNSKRLNSKRRSKVANRRNTMRRNTMRKNNKRRSKVANRKYMKRKTFGGMQRQTSVAAPGAELSRGMSVAAPGAGLGVVPEEEGDGLTRQHSSRTAEFLGQRRKDAAAVASVRARHLHKVKLFGEGPITINPDTIHAYGMADTIGHRRTMEDCMTVYGKMRSNLDYFAVFDGHGGGDVSEFVAGRAHEVIESHPDWEKGDRNIETILADSFPLITEQIMGAFTMEEVDQQGTTAVIVIIDQKMLYVANLGDARAVIGGGVGPTFYTTDHKPSSDSEIKRIMAAGWTVDNVRGTMRLGASGMSPGIAVSRAFGDLGSRHLAGPDSIVLSDVPDVSKVSLQDTDKVLIIACDGLWDVMNNDEAVKRVMYLCSRGCSAEEAAFYLRDLALLEYGSKDNISVMVVLLGEIAQDPLEKVSFFSNEDDGKLGTVFGDQWPNIKKINEGSMAGEQGKIIVGNALLAINGLSMNGKPFNDVKLLVKNRPLILTFSDIQRPSYDNDCDNAATNYPIKQEV